jgi:hypothetical protein
MSSQLIANIEHTGCWIRPSRLPGLHRCGSRHLVAWIATLIAVAALSGALGRTVQAEDAGSGSVRISERTSFSDDEIMEGFFKIAFGAELQLGRRVERIRKFDEPVRVYVFNEGSPSRAAQLASVIADIQAHINQLDMSMTQDMRAANLFVMLVQERNLKPAIRSLYGRERANQIQRALDPQCLSGFAKDKRYRIRHAEVVLPVDADDPIFYNCAYEELLQALGPINDDRSVPWTMFNDDAQMGFFDIYDQYLLNILYNQRIRPGMTKAQVGALLHEVLPRVREWIGASNVLHSAQACAAANSKTDAQCRRAVPQ